MTESAAERILTRCRRLAQCTETPGSITRTFLSDPMREVHALLRGWMEAAGMSVRVDAMGNLRGLYPGAEASRGRLLIGSHLDTVPNAGAFDGILGVVLGLAAVESLDRRPLPFAIEVLGFSEEEGVRFSRPFLGSSAMVGHLDAEMLALRDASGVDVVSAIRTFGLDPAELPAAMLEDDAMGYFEVHIEQGPVLESLGQPIGVVSAIAGQTRGQLRFRGNANHAGTTPMRLRQDALAAAAEWIVGVESTAGSTDGLVATVGRIEVQPGAGNVIAAEALATVDIRHADDSVRARAVAEIAELAKAAGRSRGVEVEIAITLDQAAVQMSASLTSVLGRAASRVAGSLVTTLVSGAGHDAMVMGERVPAAMLFVRSPGGLSHHPEEAVLVEDAHTALETVMEFLALLGDDGAENTTADA